MNPLPGNLSVVQSTLLSKINERQVLRAIQSRGPMSRAEVARYAGISAPTASKAVESLLKLGLLEEGDAPELARGRPARKLRLPCETAQVLGLVIDAEQCRVVCAGLDGRLHEEYALTFPTPNTYDALIETAAEYAARLMERPNVTTLGLGISIPGLMDYCQPCSILSPNVPITNHHSPARDLASQLNIACVMLQESHALCLAERHYGNASGMNDFAMLDVSSGVGLGVMSGGQLLTGHRGLAGEIGHITVMAEGRPCGCGNRGCLETVASDAALAREIGLRLGRKIGTEEMVELMRTGALSLTAEVAQVCRYLAIGMAAVINLFNPAILFVHGRLFDADPSLFDRIVEEAQTRALAPTFADCRIVQARGSKRQGAVAGIIEHLMNSLVPEHLSPPDPRFRGNLIPPGLR